MDDDFVSRFDSSSAYSFGSADDLLGVSTGSIKLKQKPKRTPMFALNGADQAQHGLGSRYDFSSSLSAALGTAQDKLGQRSGLMMSGNTAQVKTNGGYFGPVDRTEPAKAPMPTERPDAITTDRPAMGSDQYKDLVQKFCYVGSARMSPSVTKV